TGVPNEQVILQLVSADEYYADALHAADVAFVSQLYLDLLHRPADSGGLAYFVSLIEQGQAPRSNVVEIIEGSAEYEAIAVQALYQKYLGRLPSQQDLDSSVSFLANGGSVQGLQIMLTSSNEYFNTRGAGTNSG